MKPSFKNPLRLWDQDAFENLRKVVNHLCENNARPHKTKHIT